MTREEYNRCVDKFSDPLYRFILKTTNDNALADDIVQDSFIKLWESVDNIAYDKSKSFLFTTGYRRMIDIFRHNKRTTPLESAKEEHTEDKSHIFDMAAQIDKALDRIPKIQRDVVLLYDYEGYSYKEIGAITSLSESQVKVYIFRARHNLRSHLERKENII